MIRRICLLAAAGIIASSGTAPVANADLYEDFDVKVSERPFFDWLVNDGNFVLYPASAKSAGSFKPLLELAYDTCGLVDRVGVGSALNYLVTTPMPRQSRPMTRDQANRWLNGAVPNLCPELF